jgi:hypothetical protein
MKSLLPLQYLGRLVAALLTLYFTACASGPAMPPGNDQDQKHEPLCHLSSSHLLMLVEVPVTLQAEFLLWLRNMDPSIPEDERIRSAGLTRHCLN